MGFRKLRDDDSEDKPTKKDHRNSRWKNHTEGFEPSTAEDIKGYSKRARKAEQKRKDEKAERGEKHGRVARLTGDRLREALIGRSEFRVYRSNLFAKFIELVNDNDGSKPRYRAYLKER